MDAGLREEVSKCVRQEIRSEFAHFLRELHIFGQEFGQSLQRFIDSVGPVEADGTISIEKIMDCVGPVEADGTIPIEKQEADSEVPGTCEQLVSEAEEDSLQQSPATALEEGSRCDFSLRPSLSSDPTEKFSIYVKQCFKSMNIGFDGQSERMRGDWEILLSWPDPRLRGAKTVPENCWSPLTPSLDMYENPLFVMIGGQGVVWDEKTHATHAEFSHRDRWMEETGYGSGPWLQQRIIIPNLDVQLELNTAMHIFPHDLRDIALAICIWNLDDFGGAEERQVLSSQLDRAHHQLYGTNAVYFLPAPGGADWEVACFRVDRAMHGSEATGHTYDDVYTHVKLQRRTHFFFWKARSPLNMALAMECVGFAVSPKGEEGISYRLSASVAVFFSVVAIQLAVQGYLPKSSVLHKLDKAFQSAGMFVVAVMLESAFMHASARFGWIPGDIYDLVDIIISACLTLLLIGYLVWLEIAVRRDIRKYSQHTYARQAGPYSNQVKILESHRGHFDEWGEIQMMQSSVGRRVGRTFLDDDSHRPNGCRCCRRGHRG